jgi:hypothetical protein
MLSRKAGGNLQYETTFIFIYVSFLFNVFVGDLCARVVTAELPTG